MRLKSIIEGHVGAQGQRARSARGGEGESVRKYMIDLDGYNLPARILNSNSETFALSSGPARYPHVSTYFCCNLK